MRLISAVLFVALTGSWVLADEAKPADPKPEVTKKKVPYRVVKMLPETGQVLLFDKNHGSHVVAEVGQALDGYSIEDIDEDEVTLLADSGSQVILTAPPPPPRMAKKAAKKPQPAPVDPYADSDAGPVDPYAEPAAPTAPGEGGVRVASAAAPSTATATSVPVEAAPADPYGDPGIAAFAEAVGATPAPATTPNKPKAHKPAKSSKAAPTSDDASELAALATGAPAPATTGPATAAPAGTTTIARGELDAALADFGKLAGSFRASFTPEGLRFDSINEGTLLTKAGLRKGDVVTAVDGQSLRSLDDAANLYARASAIRTTTIQVVRAGKPVTLRIAIQ